MYAPGGLRALAVGCRAQQYAADAPLPLPELALQHNSCKLAAGPTRGGGCGGEPMRRVPPRYYTRSPRAYRCMCSLRNKGRICRRSPSSARRASAPALPQHCRWSRPARGREKLPNCSLQAWLSEFQLKLDCSLGQGTSALGAQGAYNSQRRSNAQPRHVPALAGRRMHAAAVLRYA